MLVNPWEDNEIQPETFMRITFSFLYLSIWIDSKAYCVGLLLVCFCMLNAALNAECLFLTCEESVPLHCAERQSKKKHILITLLYP